MECDWETLDVRVGCSELENKLSSGCRNECNMAAAATDVAEDEGVEDSVAAAGVEIWKTIGNRERESISWIDRTGS